MEFVVLELEVHIVKRISRKDRLWAWSEKWGSYRRCMRW